AVVAILATVLTAAYLLRMWAKAFLGTNPHTAAFPDLSARELVVLVPLLAGIVWLGLYPGPVLRRMEPASRQFVQTVQAAATTTTTGADMVSLEKGPR
ncbi:MAG TPA: hypothetical protein VIG95_08290, partial [Gemmatimonadales bacterium]